MKGLRLPLSVFAFVSFLLLMVQLKVERPMLLLERFLPGWGWLEILMVAVYAAFVAFRMQDVKQSKKWRIRTWTLFSMVFFAQLFLGLAGVDECLMTGELHVPVPAVIVSGPIYRFELGFMPVLFLSTIVLSGPAWCSHLCYMGALDAVAAESQKRPLAFAAFRRWKLPLLGLVVLVALMFRLFGASIHVAASFALAFGIAGLFLMIVLSRRKGAMVHCTVWCPVGTLVNYMRFLSPFRFGISNDKCTDCMACTAYCRYDALNAENIAKRKPGITCTLCGDCLSSCHSHALEYRFLNLKPEQARHLYLFFTVSIHAVFLALARI